METSNWIGIQYSLNEYIPIPIISELFIYVKPNDILITFSVLLFVRDIIIRIQIAIFQMWTWLQEILDVYYVLILFIKGQFLDSSVCPRGLDEDCLWY